MHVLNAVLGTSYKFSVIFHHDQNLYSRISTVELHTSVNAETLDSILSSLPVASAVIYLAKLLRNAPH